MSEIREKVCISGPCMYARLFEHNRDLRGYEDQYVPHDGMYLIEVGVEDRGPEFKRIMGWNRMYAPKIGGEDKGHELERGAEEGLAYFTFKRKHAPKSKTGMTLSKYGGPPGVKWADGKDFPSDKMIGNGSFVDVWLDVNKPEGSKITYVNLIGVVVHKLVEYEKTEESDQESPKQTSTTEDDIPF